MQRSAHLADYQYDDDFDDDYETDWDGETQCNSNSLTACEIDSNGETLYFDVDNQRDPDVIITATATSTSTKLTAKS